MFPRASEEVGEAVQEVSRLVRQLHYGESENVIDGVNELRKLDSDGCAAPHGSLKRVVKRRPT